MKSVLSVFLLFVTALPLSAQLDLGSLVPRKHKPENVLGISVSTGANEKTTLGTAFAVDVKTTETNGKKTYELATPIVPWSEFNVEVKGGVFKDGYVIITRDLAETEAGKLVLKVAYIPKPGMDTTITIELIAGKAVTMNFSGEPGESGYSGSSGTGGSTSPEGCTEGTSGQSGGSGRNGGDGPSIEVYLKKKMVAAVGRELICVMVVNLQTNDTLLRYVDPTGSLVIAANGGRGGYGGNGGHGGAGGYVYGGTYKCRGGAGGSGGDGADGGNGGKITVHVDPSVDLSKYNITFLVDGGEAGGGGGGGEGGANGQTTIPTKENRGPDGYNGRAGRPGKPGAKPVIKTEPISDKLFEKL